MIGKALGDQRAEHPLDLHVDLGDEIDRAFLFDVEVARAGQLHGAGLHDRFDRRWREKSVEDPSATARQLLHHADFHAALGRPLQLHVVHEAAHEEDAAAARLQDVLGRERIGDVVGIEAFALVADADDELGRRIAGREGELDGDELG